jgi:hypothetical protein
LDHKDQQDPEDRKAHKEPQEQEPLVPQEVALLDHKDPQDLMVPQVQPDPEDHKALPVPQEVVLQVPQD